MNRAQKHACYNLGVVGATLGTVAVLHPLLGAGALGGFALLALLGIGGFFYYHKGGEVVSDERDDAIRYRSALVAYAVFWLAFVGVGLLAPIGYGEQGAVPIFVVEVAVWGGFTLFIAVHALATLILYARGV